MDTPQLVSVLLDVGLGASALYLASKLTFRVVAQEKRADNHEVRITALEQRAA